MTRLDSAFHSNLRNVRTRAGLSQQHLAEAAGVSRQAISLMESGENLPSTSVALRLAKALGCHVEDLFYLEEALPSILARPGSAGGDAAGARVALARVDGAWVAHPLVGDAAFRTELVPADGLVTEVGADPSRLSVQIVDDQERAARAVVVAGCTPALSLWARSAERWRPDLRVHWLHANSTAALLSLARGEVHAAGVHLVDPVTGEYNLPYVQRLIPDRSVVLVNLGVWEEGFLVQPGNPLSIRDGADLIRDDVRLVNREEGAGSRLMLDSLLTCQGITASAVRGYDLPVYSHQRVAQAVASGAADVGVSTESLAALYGLDFISIRQVRYDLALFSDCVREPAVADFLATLDHRWVRSQLRLLAGYDTSRCGEIVAET